MAVIGNRQIVIQFEEDVTYQQAFDAVENQSSPGSNEIVALSNGANTISVPANSKGVTIIPPVSNAVTLTLKGVTGDTGVGLALDSPTSLGLSSTTTSFVITTNGAVNVRMIWT